MVVSKAYNIHVIVNSFKLITKTKSWKLIRDTCIISKCLLAYDRLGLCQRVTNHLEPTQCESLFCPRRLYTYNK